MWLFPAVAAAVALAFAALLARSFLRSRRSYLAFWAAALGMYAVASAVVGLGALDGWTSAEFRVFWAVGAVLNVPFLAQGEIDLLVRNRVARSILYVVLVFVTAYTIARVRTAGVDDAALAEDLPSGKEVLGTGRPPTGSRSSSRTPRTSCSSPAPCGRRGGCDERRSSVIGSSGRS
jgi:hypothetical protein